MKSDPTHNVGTHGFDSLWDQSPTPTDGDADHHQPQSQQTRPQHEQTPLDSRGRMAPPNHRARTTNSHSPPTCYRSMLPREYALGNEVRRSDNNASFVPTLLPSSTLRNSATGGSQYSWSSRGSGSGFSRGGGSWRGGEGGRGSAGGGGLSSTSITMNAEQGPLGDGGSKERVEVEPAPAIDNNDEFEQVDEAAPDEATQNHHQQRQHDEEVQDKSAMRRISEEDMTMSSGLSSLVKRNPSTHEESEEDIVCFERSIGSDSHLLHYQPTVTNTLSAHLTTLPSSPNPGVSPYESVMEEVTPVLNDAEQGGNVENNLTERASLQSTNDDEQDDDDDGLRLPISSQSLPLQQVEQDEKQENHVKTGPQDKYSGPSSQLKLDTAAPLAITHIKSPASVSTLDSESFHPELAATARFGRLLQQCRELTETCETSTVDGSEKMGSSNRSSNDDRKVTKYGTGSAPLRGAPASASQTFEPRKLFSNPIAMRTEIQTSGRVYNASDITMDPYLKSSEYLTSVDESSRAHRQKLDYSSKSAVSDISIGVDRMYHDARTGMDYTDLKRPARSSPISELSYGDRQGNDASAELSGKPHQKSNNVQVKTENGVDRTRKPNYMSYLPNGIKDDRVDRRSWLSYTDDETTPRNSAPNKGTIQTFQVPISAAKLEGMGFKKPMVKNKSQSPQSSFYSTDFSDEGTGGLLVGFGKRGKSRSSSDSSDSSSTGFSSGTSSSSSSSAGSSSSSSTSSSSSESEEETDESEPSMPAIARGGLRLTHQQDDDVSALSFGGASALVVSASRVVPIANTKLLPEENSRSRISETSSVPTKSLEKAREEKMEISPESTHSNRSSKASGNELDVGFPALKRSPPSGAESFNEDVNEGPTTKSRRSTLADSRSVIDQMPQLDEESSDAASNAPPTLRKSSSTIESMSSPGSKNKMKSVASSVSAKRSRLSRHGPGNDNSEEPAKTGAVASNCNSADVKYSLSSLGSKPDLPTQSKAISATDCSEKSPKPATASRSSRSSSTSFGSKRGKHSNIETIFHPDFTSSPKAATASRSSRCSSASFGSSRDFFNKTETIASSTTDASPKFATASSISRSSRSNSTGLGSKLASAISQLGQSSDLSATGTPNFQLVVQVCDASTSQVTGQSPRPTNENSMVELSLVESSTPVDHTIIYQRDGPSSITKREKSKAPDHFPLKRVTEEPPEFQSFGDAEEYFASPSIPNFPTENFHPNEHLINDGVRHDDERSITSSVSSVVSKARASFQSRSTGVIVTGSSSVVSALSDHSQADTKPRGSFRRSASDMITERLKSKTSVGSRSCENNQVNVGKTSKPASLDFVGDGHEQLDLSAKSCESKSRQSKKIPVQAVLSRAEDFVSDGNKLLDLSAKSGTKKPPDGYLYEGFPPHNTNDFSGLIRSNRAETTRFHSARVLTEETDARKPWRTTSRKAYAGDESSASNSQDTLPTEHEALDAMRHSQSLDNDSALSEVSNSKAALISMGLFGNDSNEGKSLEIMEETDCMAAFLVQEKHDPVDPEHLSASSTTSSITEWDFSDQVKARSKDQVEGLTSNFTRSMPSHSQVTVPSFEGDRPSSVSCITATDLTPSVVNTSGKSDPKTNEQDQKESNESPATRDSTRKSMAGIANEMSVRLEKSLLSRSQQQARNDFESRSYEDLSSASEEDAVLAYLRQQRSAAEVEYDDESPTQFDGIESIGNIVPDRKSISSESGKSDSEDRTSSFLKAFLKRKAIMNPSKNEEEKHEEFPDTGGSESEYVYAEIRPTFPDSDLDRGSCSDESDIESRSLSVVSPDEADDDSNSARSSDDKGARNRDEEERALYWTSKKFWIPLCFTFLLVFIVVVTVATTGSKRTESAPTAQPTVTQAVPPLSSSPTSIPSFVTSSSIWVQVGADMKGGPGDEMGFSVSTSKQGIRFIVGSRRNAKDNMKNRGSATIYEFDTRVGSYVVLTTIYGEQAGDQCGYSVSMSEDGKRVAIGSLGSDKNGINSGQVRVFEENDLAKEWILVNEFIGEAEGSLFGTSVSLSQNGSKLAVGAPYYGKGEAARIGRTYVYEESQESIWNSMGEPISGELSDDLLGWSVSWSPDAELLAIGAPGKEDISSSGYVKIFSYEPDQWNTYGQLISNDLPGDRFGFSVSLGGNSTAYRVAIGAPGTTSASGEGSGYACIYESNSKGWLLLGNGILGGWGEHLGYAVSLTPDAGRIAVGVPNKLSNGLPAGQIQIFDISAKSLVSTGTINGNEGEDFGVSVDISNDGRIVYGGATLGNLVRVLGEI